MNQRVTTEKRIENMWRKESDSGRKKKERRARERMEVEVEVGVVPWAICLSTNTCVSIHYAGELIMLSQHSSALQRRRKKAEGANRDKLSFHTGILHFPLLYIE